MSVLNAYREAAVSTQSKGKIVVMLYEGAIRFLKQSITAMENKDYPEKAKYITKALDIINELNVVLDMDSGGEVAQNLRALYLFMNKHLNQASVKCDVPMVQEVIGLLEELNAGWKEIVA